jgi:hypothetical protein
MNQPAGNEPPARPVETSVMRFSRPLVGVACLLGCATAPVVKGTVIPATFEEGLFIARPVLKDSGKPLALYLDTGGNNIIHQEVVERLGLRPVERREAGQVWEEVALPAFRPDTPMPLPLTRDGRLIVLPRGESVVGEWDGMLGPEWFGGRVWRFDYPDGRLVLLETGPPLAEGAAVPLGFQDGLYFPRIQVEIDRRRLDLLLDTGAQVHLSEGARAALADGRGARRATSFMAASVFDRWRRDHPTWRVIEHADEDLDEAMIEVPSVVIAGQPVGPVWFTRRPDPNFHQFMSQFMDQKIDGAVGGNALGSFRMTVDYPNETALFVR